MMTPGQTLHLEPPMDDLDTKYFNIANYIGLKKIKDIRKLSLCETTRKKLTDINTSGHALIESIYPKCHPDMFIYVKRVGERFKKTLDIAQGQLSENKCEYDCYGASQVECCKVECKRTCKDCKENCVDCKSKCEDDC